MKSIYFDQNLQAFALYVEPSINPSEALAHLNISGYQAMIVMHSGAAFMEGEIALRLPPLFAEGLAHFAQNYLAIVADGGTEAGGMKLMGEARHAIRGAFPLIGVTAAKSITYPAGPAKTDDRWELNRFHTHFLIVEGDRFGVESELLVGLAQIEKLPSVALIVNGGELVRKETEMHIQNHTPIITLKGSGRFADELSENRTAYPEDTPIIIFDIDKQSPRELYDLLRQLLFHHF